MASTPSAGRQGSAQAWALGGILGLAALLRLPTLGSQSLWFDEAFIPTHVLHAGLGATLSAVSHTENTPPLFYLLEWASTRVLGTDEVALRLLSAIAGLATVAVSVWVGRELHSRRAGLILGLLVAVNPLFVWYSQEARAYALFGLTAAVSFALFLRARRLGTPASLLGWAVASSLALLTHYFAALLIAAEAAWLLWSHPGRRREVLAVVGVGAVGLALVPLVVAQGGHGAQWIERWALGSRLVAVPQYFVLGPSAEPLGHAILLLAMVPFVAVGALLLRSEPSARSAVRLAASVGAAGMLPALVLALVGEDYLAPRNLIAAWLIVTAAVAVVLAADPPWPARPPAGGSARHRARLTPGLVLTAALAVLGVGLAGAVAVNFKHLQRGDWKGVAAVMGRPELARAVVTAGLGSAPLEYYQPPLRALRAGERIMVSEVDAVGYRPLVRGAARPPGPAFHLTDRHDVNGLVVLRFRAQRPLMLDQATLLARRITAVRSQVLVSVPAG
ncbi:MAG TPA: glycosyltransferase family 39 protein [Solirubrobacteraceae bacterium]|jgi:hypothetical protein|nr:glycosyltransferase family 39 protein [Solirubrobacteraceae bacterium]